MKRPIFYIYFLSFISLYLAACNHPQEDKEKKIADYIKAIPGESDSIPAETIQKGKVLIAYSDCLTCHKEDERSFGPAYKDVAKRYPVNKVFIQMLAQKVIAGGSGGWGNAVMLSHPQLSVKDAEAMVSYVLSLKE